ncbi:MAG: transposase [Candidatus Hodarchaeota archaeon]
MLNFQTKIFESFLEGRVYIGRVRDRLLELFSNYAEKFDTRILALEIMSDHVHLFLSVKSSVAPSQIALYLKG